MTNTTAPGSASGVPASNGKTTINDAVIAKVAGLAAREVSGVFALGGGAARALGAIRDAMNSKDLSQGISVEVGETQVAVDVSVVAEYPVPLQAVAEGVRVAVTNAIERLVGMEVTEVNVSINDVHLPADDKDDQAEARVQCPGSASSSVQPSPSPGVSSVSGHSSSLPLRWRSERSWAGSWRANLTSAASLMPFAGNAHRREQYRTGWPLTRTHENNVARPRPRRLRCQR